MTLTEHDFKTRREHKKLSYLVRPDKARPAGRRRHPTCIRLDPLPGAVPSDKAPVRIYMGTEPAQFRAERVLIWSIMQVRDPARVYEIYLMKDLEGYDRTKWKTGFTNYRFAIPAMAGNTGRAIYNDVDQLYLGDPAELFDMDMDGHGQMCITRRETSVMLLDCDKLGPIWSEQDAKAGVQHKVFRAKITDIDGMWGELPGIWNARDGEFVEGRSKLLHYTTLQTQPWRPFPDQLKYADNPLAYVFDQLEESADAAGFTVFTEDRPGDRYADLMAAYRAAAASNDGDVAPGLRRWLSGGGLAKQAPHVAALIKKTGAASVYVEGCGGVAANPWPGTEVIAHDPVSGDATAPVDRQADIAVSVDSLQRFPDEDVPWLLDRLFGRARTAIFATVSCAASGERLATGDDAHVTVQPPHWWEQQFLSAARRHPGKAWTLRADAPVLSLPRTLTYQG